MSNYRGITHGLPTWEWFLALRRRFYCSREIHMWDEVEEFGAEPVMLHPDMSEEQKQEKIAGFMDTITGHHLVCDACQLMVNISGINDYYVDKTLDDILGEDFPTEYMVKSGDSPSSIAEAHGLTLAELRDLNGWKVPKGKPYPRIHPGQKVRVRSDG